MELATDAEATGLSAGDRALVPSNLAALRGAAGGLASLDGSTRVPEAQLPAATTAVQGAIRLATVAEAAARADDDTALSPFSWGQLGNIPNGWLELDGGGLVPANRLPSLTWEWPAPSGDRCTGRHRGAVH